MSGLMKMKIMPITGNGNSFTLKINPASLNFTKSIEYTTDKVKGSSEEVTKYYKHGPTTLSFDFILDSTGIAYTTTEDLHQTVEKFEDVVYKIKGETHKPNLLQISWGTIVFYCGLESLKYDYTLFSPEGNPLRVKISVSFSGYIERYEEVKKAQKSSPDLSHYIILKEGETIAFWCNKIYGDFSYCKDVAEFNGIPGFRNIKPGTKLMFPKISRRA